MNLPCLPAFHVNCLGGFLNRQHRQQYPRSKTCMHLCWFLLTKNTLFAHGANSQKLIEKCLLSRICFKDKQHHPKTHYIRLKYWEKSPSKQLKSIETWLTIDVILCLAGAQPSLGDSLPKKAPFWVLVTEILTKMWGPYPYHPCKVRYLYPHLAYFYDNCR